MASRHEPKKHDHCDHDLRLCGQCDIAYCAKCSKEWGAQCHLYHYPVTWTYTQPTYPGTTTTWGLAAGGGGSVTDEVYIYNASSAHDHTGGEQ